MKLSFKKGILLVNLGGERTNKDLDILIDLIKDDGFSNVLIQINRDIALEELENLEMIKNFKNVLII